MRNIIEGVIDRLLKNSKMSAVGSFELKLVCRGCMGNVTPETTTSETDLDELRGIFERFTDIQIKTQDDLPRLFCKVCADLLKTFKSFIEKAKNINKLLLTITPQHGTSNSHKWQTNVCKKHLSKTNADKKSKQAAHRSHDKKDLSGTKPHRSHDIQDLSGTKPDIKFMESKLGNSLKSNSENLKTDCVNQKTDGQNQKTDGNWQTKNNVVWLSNDALNQKIHNILHSENSDVNNQNNNENCNSDDKINQEMTDHDLNMECDKNRQTNHDFNKKPAVNRSEYIVNENNVDSEPTVIVENLEAYDDNQMYVVEWLSNENDVWFAEPILKHLQRDENQQNNEESISDSDLNKTTDLYKNRNTNGENNVSRDSDNHKDENWLSDDVSNLQGCLDFDNNVNVQCKHQIRDEEQQSDDCNLFTSKLYHKNTVEIRQTDRNVRKVENNQGDIYNQETERNRLTKDSSLQGSSLKESNQHKIYILPRNNKINNHSVKSSAGVENLQTDKAQKISEKKPVENRSNGQKAQKVSETKPMENCQQPSISLDEQLQIASQQTSSILRSLLQDKNYINFPTKLLSSEQYNQGQPERKSNSNNMQKHNNIQPSQDITGSECKNQNITENESFFNDHCYTKVTKMKIICNYCAVHFSTEYTEEQKKELKNMIFKMKLVEGTQTHKYRCTRCGLRVNSEGQRMYICRECPEGFVTRWQRDRHIMRTHRPLERYYCTNCPSSYELKDSLKDHILNKHTGDHCPYVCNICGKRYKQKRILDRHLRLHGARLKPAHLCTLCGYSTYTTGNLRTHMVLCHSDEKPFECDHCGYKCKTKGYIKTHMRTHNRDLTKKFLCQYCDRKCMTKLSLMSHEKHHRQPEVQFPVCPKRFHNKPKLRRHLTGKHKYLPIIKKEI